MMERSWIMGKFSCGGLDGGGGRGGGLRLGRLGGDGGGDVVLGNGGGGDDAGLDDADDAPAFQAAERTGLHDLDLVTNFGLVFLVVDVEHGLAVDDLVVKRVRRLVG